MLNPVLFEGPIAAIRRACREIGAIRNVSELRIDRQTSGGPWEANCYLKPATSPASRIGSPLAPWAAHYATLFVHASLQYAIHEFAVDAPSGNTTDISPAAALTLAATFLEIEKAAVRDSLTINAKEHADQELLLYIDILPKERRVAVGVRFNPVAIFNVGVRLNPIGITGGTPATSRTILSPADWTPEMAAWCDRLDRAMWKLVLPVPHSAHQRIAREVWANGDAR
jgi:hypothetical protein